MFRRDHLLRQIARAERDRDEAQRRIERHQAELDALDQNQEPPAPPGGTVVDLTVWRVRRTARGAAVLPALALAWVRRHQLATSAVGGFGLIVGGVALGWALWSTPGGVTAPPQALPDRPPYTTDTPDPSPNGPGPQQPPVIPPGPDQRQPVPEGTGPAEAPPPTQPDGAQARRNGVSAQDNGKTEPAPPAGEEPAPDQPPESDEPPEQPPPDEQPDQPPLTVQPPSPDDDRPCVRARADLEAGAEAEADARVCAPSTAGLRS